MFSSFILGCAFAALIAGYVRQRSDITYLQGEVDRLRAYIKHMKGGC